jgi:hypothetical protein
MPAIYFDESGFTGPALLDPQQPLFVIASSIIGEDDAARILRTAFPKYQGSEFKLQRLWNRPSSRAGIARFCELIGERASDVYVWNVDKKFCVLLKMIDFLIEPLAHLSGHDFYKGAYAYKYANFVHTGLRHIGSAELYDATVSAYYDFARTPTEKALDLLCFRLSVMANSVPAELRFFFDSALLGAETFHEHSRMETFGGTLEIYLTSMLNSVGYWSQRVEGDLDILHDESKAFFAQRTFWDAITSKDVPAQFHPVANGPAICFPLPVRSTQALNSKDHFAIQLCDLLAGITAKLGSQNRQESDRDLWAAIFDTDFANVPMNGLAPGTEFPERGPELRGGPDPVDQMIEIIRSGGGLTE